jgi:hypothetical protein
VTEKAIKAVISNVLKLIDKQVKAGKYPGEEEEVGGILEKARKILKEKD